MDGDEREIYQFLKTGEPIRRRDGDCPACHHQKKILRRARLGQTGPDADGGPRHSGKRQSGPLPHQTGFHPGKNKRWVAPDIAKILQESGVKVEAGDGIAPDEYYDQL